ncbi:hypothetical protein ANCDUO_08962 [Ancylostoma duodenale]|uniref:HTH La-type RNA-binding domain-containing protein n=1 Tax=Ancylostoma duodenale TaxID=51022 RepID=A0A0C2GUD2_9BILA|nr:hypothetical protein ANCDUO_08962 [Ancylostoma duodenale]
MALSLLMDCTLLLAIQIDRSQIERMVGDLEKAPPPPIDAPPAPQLPYWFTTECRNNLVNCDVPAMSVPSAPSPIPPPLPMPDLKQQLKAQLEYYFSRSSRYASVDVKLLLNGGPPSH